MRDMPEILLQHSVKEITHEGARSRKEVAMQVLREEFSLERTVENSREEPHWGETVQLFVLSENVCLQGEFVNAQYSAYGDKAVFV